jgi:hypothetical protein
MVQPGKESARQRRLRLQRGQESLERIERKLEAMLTPEQLLDLRTGQRLLAEIEAKQRQAQKEAADIRAAARRRGVTCVKKPPRKIQ